MGRDVIGVEWGNYHRTKKDKKGRGITPVIYTFCKSSFVNCPEGKPILYIKVGRTKRHPKTRLTEYKNQNNGQFRILKYWNVEQESLVMLEKNVLDALKKKYGNPCEGKEVFIVDTIDSVLELINSILGES